MSLTKIRFEEFAEINPQMRLQKGHEYPFIEMGLVIPEYRYVRPRNRRPFKSSGAKFQNGDTLFARITPCLENGKIAQAKYLSGDIGFGSTEFFVFRSRPSVSDPAYIYYLASTPIIRGPAEKSMSGASGRQRADISVIKKIKVLVPDLKTQHKIAVILSAYDDLINNNLQRIKILEEMAQNLYREWFVKFRFPGHEQARMVDSPLGKIPEWWRVLKVTDAIDFKPKTTVPKEGKKPFVPMNCLSNSSMIISDHEWREGNSGAKFRNGDTLFARITPCLENGKTGFVQFLSSRDAVGFGSTEFIVMRSKTVSPEFVYLMARSGPFRDNAIKSMSGATGRQRVRDACFETFLFSHPDNLILTQFTEIVSPIFCAVFNLDQRNNNLRQTRDLLLPKLISGELDVSGLDIETRQKMA